MASEGANQPEKIEASIAGTGNGAPAAAFAGAFLGCLATLHLSAFGVVPQIASALATSLLCGQVLIARTTGSFPSEFFPAVYGGTFGGMTPVLLLSDHAPDRWALFISLSIVCGLIFGVVAKVDARSGSRLALGYGGRSGAIATVASLLFVELAPRFGVDDRIFRAVPADVLDLEPSSAALTWAACTIGTFATLLVLRRARVASAETADRTFIASSLALISLIALHQMRPNDARTLDAFYAGCFLGMSTPERLKGWVEPALGAVVLTAMLVQIRMYLPNAGGSLGFAAFVTVAVLVALRRIVTRTMRDVFTRDAYLETAMQTPGRGLVIYTGTPDSARIRFAHWGASRAGEGRRLAMAVGGLLAIGCLTLAYQFVPERSGSDTATTVIVAEQPTPPAAQLVLVQEKPGSVDGAVQPGAAIHDADSASVTELPREPRVASGRPSESGERRVLEDERLDAAIRPTSRSVEAVETVADQGTQGQAAGLDRTDLDRTGVAPQAASEDAHSAATNDDATVSREQLFRDFLQWRAARAVGIAQVRPQPNRQNPSSQTVGPLTPAGSLHLARSGRERRPDHHPRSPSAAEPADSRRAARHSGIGPGRLLP